MGTPLAISSLPGPLFGAAKSITVDPAHLELATRNLWLALGALALFFVVRPELWRRLAIGPVDPRPAALTRIFFGITIFWTLLDLTMWGEILFTDQGMFTTEVARKKYGHDLRTAWDPEQGFGSWWAMVKVLASSWTVLHIRSDPPFVYTIYALTFASVSAMVLGFRTRLATFLTFLGVMQIYNYSPIWYAGGDTVTRCMLLLGVFCRWGEAYSLDAWLRRRRAILRGASQVPALRPIPAWPQRLMMLQLAVIYCSTGLLKSGHTWGGPGTAIYFAVNLDHFYRFPMTGFATALQRLQILRVQTWLVHWWECLFPIAIIGVALGSWERTRALRYKEGEGPGEARDARYRDVGEQPWGPVPAWRRVGSWVLLVAGLFCFAVVAGLAAKYHYDVRYLPPALRIGPERMRLLVQAAVSSLPLLLVGLYVGIRRLSARAQARVEAAKGPAPFKTRVAAGAHWFVLHWVLGKRLWLGLGTAMHLGIAVLLNVGTFVHVMLAVYPVWLTGAELDRVLRYLGSQPAAPGEAGRPAGRRALPRAIVDRFWYRVAADPFVVLHHPGEASVRRAALLRCWDLAGRLRFEADPAVSPERLVLRAPDGARLAGGMAGAALTNLLPGLWMLWLPGLVIEQVIRPLGILPDRMRDGVGRVAARLLDQRP